MKKIKQKFKVIKEYSTYYLCESELGIKECFSKTLYKPDSDGFIIKIIEESE